MAPFREADSARVRYLNADECRRLINACPEPLRGIVRGALLTGARYGELTRMRVSDFHHNSGTLLVRQSKVGKIHHVELTTEGPGFFHGITAGRDNTEFLFHRDGALWEEMAATTSLVEACRAASVTPAISFHILRHTYASLMVMDGVPAGTSRLRFSLKRTFSPADRERVLAVMGAWREENSTGISARNVGGHGRKARAASEAGTPALPFSPGGDDRP